MTSSVTIFKHVDIPEADLIWLLRKIDSSDSAKAILSNLVLKLKLEFGEELATQRRQEREEIERRTQNEEALYQHQMAQFEAKSAEYEINLKRFNADLKAMDDLIFRGFFPKQNKLDVIPESLTQMYEYLIRINAIKYTMFGKLKWVQVPINPYEQDLPKFLLSERPSKGLNSMLYFGSRMYVPTVNPGY